MKSAAPLLAAAALLLTPLLLRGASAKPPGVEVQVLPDSVDLPEPGRAVKALVVVRNATTETLSGVRLFWFTDPGVKVVAQGPASRTLRVGGETAWSLWLSNPRGALISDAVNFRVNYTAPAKGDARPAPQVALASLKIQNHALESADQAVDVQVKTTLESLDEQHPGQVYLVITNKLSVPIRVKSLAPQGPPYIVFGAPRPAAAGAVLPPRGTQVFEIDVRAKNRVRSGKDLLTFDVSFGWGQPEQTRDVVVSQAVSVGVLGESAVLTLLAVPSFLVLPGFLVLATVGLLWQTGLFKSRHDTGQFPLAANTPGFWVPAITLSIVLVALYNTLWQNLFEGYGLADIVRVWFGSVFLGAVSYCAVMAVRNLLVQARTPSAGDAPGVVLRKLKRQGLGVVLDRVNLTLDGHDQRAFLLQPLEAEREMSWIGPDILVEWRETDAQIEGQIQAQLGAGGDAERLAQALEAGMKRGILTVRWNRLGQLDRPYEAKTGDLSPPLQPNSIITQE